MLRGGRRESGGMGLEGVDYQSDLISSVSQSVYSPLAFLVVGFAIFVCFGGVVRVVKSYVGELILHLGCAYR